MNDQRNLAWNRTGWIREVKPWHEPVNGAELLDELAGVLRRFVLLPDYGTEAMALWILHTYAFELRDVSAYVGIESPEKRCGKTTLLGVLSELVNRPVVAANISSPAFFRVIEETRPTLLIDEADTFLQGNDELKGILNSGYSRTTAFVVRVANEGRGRVECESGEWLQKGTERTNALDSKPEIRNPNEGSLETEAVTDGRSQQAKRRSGSRLVRYSSWCPKAVAAIGRLPETLADRCIVIRMHRKTAGERCERLKSLDGEVLRRKCARFVLDHAEEIQRAQPVIPEGLNDRAADIWEPLFVLAEIAGRASQSESESESGGQPRMDADGHGCSAGITDRTLQITNMEGRGSESEGESGTVELLSPALSSPGRGEGDGALGERALPVKSWAMMAREAAMGLTAAAQQSHPIASLLLDVAVVFMQRGKEKLFSRDLVAGLVARGLRPWNEMVRGRELTELMLAQLLRAYGVRPRTVWMDGESAKGYVKEDFDAVFKRYVPRAEVEALAEEVVPECEKEANERRKKEAEEIVRELEELDEEVQTDPTKVGERRVLHRLRLLRKRSEKILESRGGRF